MTDTEKYIIDISNIISNIEKNTIDNINENIIDIEKKINKTIFSYSNNNVIVNDSFQFDQELLKPTFIFQSGLPGNSFAFFLAKNVGLNSTVLKRAKKYLGNRQKQLEKSITTLQKNKKEYEKLLLESRKEILKAEKIQEEYQTQKEKIGTQKEKIISDAKLKASEIVNSASTLVETTIRELKEAKKLELDIKKEFKVEQERLLKEARTIKLEEAVKNIDAKTVDVLSIGDSVGMIDNTGIGIVLEADNNKTVALVSCNGIKFRLPYSQLYLRKNNAKIEKPKSIPLKLDVDTKLDLRGYRVDEALQEVEKFISQALQGNANYISIIHGKGTGILREAIHNYLKTFSEIKNFRLGETFEGGSGATFVYFY